MDFPDPGLRLRLLRRYQALRILGFAILLAGVAWLVAAESAALAPAALTMAVGATVASSSVLWLARFETRRDRSTRRAVRHLVAGFGLKVAALPLVALGGGWLAWGGADVAVALAVAGLGLSSYVYGVVARIDGLSMLPTGAHYA